MVRGMTGELGKQLLTWDETDNELCEDAIPSHA